MINDENTAELEQQENENQEEYQEKNSQENTQDVQNQTEESEEDTTDWKAEALKYKAILNRNKNKKPEEQRVQQSNDLSTKDLYALMDSKVPEEDIDEVRDYAKLKNISISEALKSTIVKSLLSEKAEQRNVAKASNTGTTRRSSKLSDEALLDAAKKGKLTNLSDDDIARLAGLKG